MDALVSAPEGRHLDLYNQLSGLSHLHEPHARVQAVLDHPFFMDLMSVPCVLDAGDCFIDCLHRLQGTERLDQIKFGLGTISLIIDPELRAHFQTNASEHVRTLVAYIALVMVCRGTGNSTRDALAAMAILEHSDVLEKFDCWQLMTLCTLQPGVVSKVTDHVLQQTVTPEMIARGQARLDLIIAFSQQHASDGIDISLYEQGIVELTKAMVTLSTRTVSFE